MMVIHGEQDHSFGQDVVREGERRTWWVILLTGFMMVVEVAGGMAFGSMALLADGLHMASHAGALSIAIFGYAYARRHAFDRRFSFGTGKVNALAGFTGALLLAGFALAMVGESVGRLVAPVSISFDEAIFVAVLGFVVNGLSIYLLGVQHDHDHDHDHNHDHGHGAVPDDGQAAAVPPDHNLHSAYLHVLADTLTSVLAVVALLSGKFLGYGWMDPVMGILGSLLVARWSMGLFRSTAAVLLDEQAPPEICDGILEAIDGLGGEVTDLHVWSIGPGLYSAIVSVETDAPECASRFRETILSDSRISHLTVEVRAARRLAEASGGAR